MYGHKASIELSVLSSTNAEFPLLQEGVGPASFFQVSTARGYLQIMVFVSK